MTRQPRPGAGRILRLWLAAFVASAGAVVLPVTPAQAACAGVTVIVDFGSLGGGTQSRCVGGDPTSGIGALSSAGFKVTFVTGQFGLVCQVDSRPASTCVDSPSDQAYWSYWHAQPGGTWNYSNEGATTYDPPAGSVEGWAFGAGRQPGIAPPAAPAPPPPPVPVPPAPTAGPGHPQPGVTTTAPGPQSAAPSAATSSSTVASPEPSGVPVTESPTPTAATPEPEKSTGLPWQLGLLGVLILGGLAFWQVKRRRAR